MCSNLCNRQAKRQSGLLACSLAATLCLLLAVAAPEVHAQGAFVSSCQVPDGQSAEAIVLRVERRLGGDWNLATKTLRQTISRQQRLGQDSSAAQAYLNSLECLQAEVNGGQHDAFLTATNGKPPQRQAPATTPSKIPAPAAPAAAAAAATSQVPSGQTAVPPSQQPALAAVQPNQPAVSTPQVPNPQPTLSVQPQPADGIVMPGTAASYGESGQIAAMGTNPIVRPLDGSAPQLQLSTPARPVTSGPVLRVPPKPPKFKGESLEVLTLAATRPTPVPAASTATDDQPQSYVVTPVPAAPEPEVAAAAPAVVEKAGDPEIVGQACVYFTRPEVEMFENRMHTNRYGEGERVCYEGAMYRCDSGRWSDQGACSAHPDAASLEVSDLESEPRREY